jgi:hypothetical protein
VERWLSFAGLLPLCAAAGANAQFAALTDHAPPPPAASTRTIDLRLTQEPAFNQFSRPSTGFIADTQVAPNSRVGFSLINVSRPKLGPEWRTDGRSTRSRKPAVSFTFRF